MDRLPTGLSASGLHFTADRHILGLYPQHRPGTITIVQPGGAAWSHRAEQIIRTWKLDAGLVVLCVCQTGLGVEAGGEGFLGVSQALFVAGARSVVLCFGRAPDNTTAFPRGRFYENILRRGMWKAEALSKAGVWLRSLTAAKVDVLVESNPAFDKD